MHAKRATAQAGSAFFVILIAIFMFAALSYAVFRSSRSSESLMSGEQARIAAEEIISIASSVNKAVQTLRLRGCAETQLSFYAPEEPWHNNPLAPTDKTCHIYDSNGGNVNYTYAAPNWVEEADENSWIFTSERGVTDIGTPNGELIMVMQDLKPQICDAINNILRIENTTEEYISNAYGFEGQYDPVTVYIGDEAGSGFRGQSMGCMRPQDHEYGDFYAVLLAR